MSMSNPKILIVDDDHDLVQSVSEALDFAGYQVAAAYNGVEAIEQARLQRPTVIILDIMMPLMDGYHACQILKSDPDTRDIPILMLTSKGQTSDRIQGFEAGVDQYLTKPFDVAELKARIASLVKSRKAQQAVAPVGTKKCLMYITLDRNCNFQVELRGAETFVGEGGHFDADLEQMRRRSRNLGQYLVGTDQWRFEAKSLGRQLYEGLFEASPTLIGRYSAAQARGRPKDLCIYFRGGRELIGLPFELLFDDREYIALRHPLARTVSDIALAGSEAIQPFSAHLKTLASEGERLRILLVEANTVPPLEHVQKEVEELTSLFQQELRQSLVEKEVTVVRSQEATYEEVTKLVEVGQFDIVHYAGHGLERDDTPEQNALVLWKGKGSQKLEPLPAHALVDVLRDSNVQFFYLSGCLGAATGAYWQLWDDDFLGLMDGVVQAGVPAVLGFRWAVTDHRARMFAGAFYRSLFGEAGGVLEDAVFRARRERARATRDDPTWLSPVLVTQIQG
jgi:two-component system alkaline phosphatase synthesis response regulator PhoP